MDKPTDPLLQKFFMERGQKEKTRELYHYVFDLWFKVTGNSPTTMIEEAEDEEDQQVRLRKRKINQHFLDFTNYLLDKNFSDESIKVNTSFIRAFYNHFNIELPKRIKVEKRDGDLGPLIPSLEDIQLAISRSNPCYQAIIILMCSSGMGRAEILSLTVKNFILAVNQKNPELEISLKTLPNQERKELIYDAAVKPLVWNITRIKTSKQYFTFSSSESYKYIMLHLASKPEITDENTPLFLNMNNNPIPDQSFNQYFRDINRRCGWSKYGKLIYFRSHNLRKWFASQLENSLGYINTERLMAHSVLSDTAKRYFKPDLETIYKLYYQNMDKVTIVGKVEFHEYTDERVNELQAEIEKRDELDRARDQREKAMNAEIDRITKELVRQSKLLEDKKETRKSQLREDKKEIE